MTLTEFLLARIAEDEAGCGGGDEPRSWCDRATGVHYDPDRVLAECRAKRRIVAIHAPYWNNPNLAPESAVDECSACGDVPNVAWPCATILALAAIYADHPDYREEWRS